MVFQKAAVFSAVMASLLLCACGGGGSDDGAGSGGNSVDAVAQNKTSTGGLSAEVLSAIENLPKEVYALTDTKGAYGKKLSEDGWTFVLSTTSSVPNTPETIVYINSADPQADPQLLADFHKGFKGTLVLDSEKSSLNQSKLHP